MCSGVAPGRPAEGLQDADDAGAWSRETEAEDKSLELSQHVMESLLQGASVQLENEACLMGISSRLQTALEKMLMAITDTTDQVQTTQVKSSTFQNNRG